MNPTITIPTEIGCFHSRFTILQKLGEGTYGNVYKILDKPDFFTDCKTSTTSVSITIVRFSVFKYVMKKLDMLCV